MKKQDLQWIYFGQRNPKFNYEDFELLRKLQRLTNKHQRLCTYDCNGEGFVKGKFYRCDGSVKGAYIDEDTTIFYSEIIKTETKMETLVRGDKCFSFDFQHDPRGLTAKIFYRQSFVNWKD